MASQFNDKGVNSLYFHLVNLIDEKFGHFSSSLHENLQIPTGMSDRKHIVPPDRVRYLAEIADAVIKYKKDARSQGTNARKWWQLQESLNLLVEATQPENPRLESQSPRITELPANINKIIKDQIDYYHKLLTEDEIEIIQSWEKMIKRYTSDIFVYSVRDKEIKVPTFTTSISHQKIPKIALPDFRDWGEILEWTKLENLPGKFPFTAGVFPFKRIAEDPTRMFAGEGLSENTNRRFHYLAKGQQFARLSTAFDSVTLYGQDPHERLDIYGKIGESGVSICTVEDIERLYAGFDLNDPSTSVSMTINGPAPIMLAFFMNAAIRQNVRRWLVDNNKATAAEAYVRTGDGRYGINVHTGDFSEVDDNTQEIIPWEELRKMIADDIYGQIMADTLKKVRGTVQADILKEDQAQNTCIFSTDFSLRLMGDLQQAFINHGVRNYYSVSISGYHIAEAGANPISQLAFTLSNGFTFLEYYRSRGMHVDDFAPNFSFFFSNGLDPEYSVIGRVARRIWAIAMKNIYKANERSQKLKYHIQTSGRSLHAQEVDFNDIRTTLQALLAIYDNCNSLHTNAFDEALTTPTEESVRRAMAIQLIINKEFGGAKNENPNQGAFIINDLTELVEEAVLMEFQRLTERGGVLGAMETQYQRSKIQEESMHYEMMKMDGSYPIIGVNTFLNPNRQENAIEVNELIRSTPKEKNFQIERLKAFQEKHREYSKDALLKLQHVAISGGNIFEELLSTVQFCSLGQISSALYNVGGEYRRNL